MTQDGLNQVLRIRGPRGWRWLRRVILLIPAALIAAVLFWGHFAPGPGLLAGWAVVGLLLLMALWGRCVAVNPRLGTLRRIYTVAGIPVWIRSLPLTRIQVFRIERRQAPALTRFRVSAMTDGGRAVPIRHWSAGSSNVRSSGRCATEARHLAKQLQAILDQTTPDRPSHLPGAPEESANAAAANDVNV